MKRVRVKDPPWFIPWIYGLVIVIAITVSLAAVVILGLADITQSTTTQVISHHLFRTELDESMPASSDIVVWNFRVLRGILTAIVRVGLAVSDVAMQILVRSPLTDPYPLGISAGAGAGATVMIIFGTFSESPIAPLTFGVLLNAVVATLAIDTFTTADGGLIPLHLVLSGIVLPAAFSALSSFMIFAGPDPGTAQFVMPWVLGSVAGATWTKALFPLIVLITVLLFFLIKARRLDTLAIGEDTVAAVGIDVIRLRTQVSAFQVVLAGTLVMVSGGIGFAGLMTPRLTRILVGATHRVVLPVVVLMDGLLLIWADVIARAMGGNQEMPSGAAIGPVEAPLFLYLMSRSHYSYGGVE